MLRVRVEVLPYGMEGDAIETIHEAYVFNDGTGTPGGPDVGGVGNYCLCTKNPNAAKYPIIDLGRLERLERTPWHRLVMARTALQRLENRARNQAWTAALSEPGATAAALDKTPLDNGEGLAE